MTLFELLFLFCPWVFFCFLLERRIAKIEKMLRGKVVLMDISHITQDDKIVISNYIQ